MIIFSVLFALFVNEWRNNVNERKQTAVILNNIEQELQRNQAIAQEFYTYHEEVLLNMRQIYEQDSLSEKFLGNGRFEIFEVAPRGVYQKAYKNIAWEVAKEERISSRIDFDISSAIFEAYNQQNIVNSTIARTLDLLNEPHIHDEQYLKQNVIRLATLFGELRGQEESLLTYYKYALQKLETS